MEDLVDLVTRGNPGEPWRMVLVEEGPWEDADVDLHLRRLQSRLYNCIDAAIDGMLAQQYPESRGVVVVIRLDGYDLPVVEVRSFFERFSSSVFAQPDYAAAVAQSEAVKSIGFELHLEGQP